MSQLDLTKLHQLHTFAQTTQRVRSLLIMHHGQTIFEEYYLDCTPYHYQNTYSITKSVVSILVGIALQHGYLQHLDQPILDFFPEYHPHDDDPRKHHISKRTLFTPLGIWHNTNGHTFDTPHSFFQWDDTNNVLWSLDSTGIHTSTAGLQLTSQEMARLGFLYLQQGQWHHQHIVPPTYINASIQPIPPHHNYGYLWWLSTYHTHPIYSAEGYGDQSITIIPHLNLVTVMTCTPTELNHPGQQVLHDYILPAFQTMDANI